MAADNVITGALAIISVNGEVIGKMRGIEVNENIQRGEVRGLGSIVPSEAPALTWAGTLRCDFYNIDFRKSQIPKAIIRDQVSLKEWADTLVLTDEGVTVDIYKKVTDIIDPTTGVITPKKQSYAQIKQLYLNTENFNINEGQISGRNQSFVYLEPIIFVKGTS